MGNKAHGRTSPPQEVIPGVREGSRHAYFWATDLEEKDRQTRPITPGRSSESRNPYRRPTITSPKDLLKNINQKGTGLRERSASVLSSSGYLEDSIRGGQFETLGLDNSESVSELGESVTSVANTDVSVEDRDENNHETTQTS